MLKVGLTGGIGSGKTTASDYFESLGVPVIDADQISHQLTQPDCAAYHAIVDQFGKLILKDRHIDRKLLAQQVFNDPLKRQQLEAIIHPLVVKEILRQVEALNNLYCIISIPLLIEADLTHLVDRIIVIDTAEAIRKQRIRQRNGLNDAEIEARFKAQLSRDARLKQADDIITNNSTTAQLLSQIDQLHRQYSAPGEQPIKKYD